MNSQYFWPQRFFTQVLINIVLLLFMMIQTGCIWISGAVHVGSISSSNPNEGSGGGDGTSSPSSPSYKLIAVDPTEPALNADSTPGDGICATSNSKCSFQAAISTAAEYSIPVTIYLPAGTYSITAGTSAISKSDVTIQGATQAGTILDGTAFAPGTSLGFVNTLNATNFSLKTMTIRSYSVSGVAAVASAVSLIGGSATLDSVTFDSIAFTTGGVRSGPALSVSSATSASISNSTFKNNSNVYFGGAVYVTGSQYVSFDSCTFDNNTSTGGDHMYWKNNSGNNSINASTFKNGTAAEAIWFRDTTGAFNENPTSIANSTFSNNLTALTFNNVEGATISNTTFSGGTDGIYYTNSRAAPNGSNLTLKHVTISQTMAANKNLFSNITDATYSIVVKNSIIYNSGAGGSCNAGGTARFT